MVLKERTNGKQDVGLALLGVGSAFGIFSSLNTSPVGLVSFGTDPEKLSVTYAGLNTSLVIILASAAGIGLYYKEKGYAAAAATAATGIGMWLWYDHLIKTHSPQQ
jgi:hypothetical protein